MQVHQVLFHSSHTAVDAHVVVVEDDEQVVGGVRCVVQSLEGQSAAHGSVANDGNDMALRIVCSERGQRHAQRGRNGVAGVSAGKGIVGTFQRRGEGPYAVKFPVGGEGFAAACQNFMAVGLVAHIPHDAVGRCVEHIVQGHRQFHRPQTGREMSRIVRQFVNDVAAQLFAHGGEFSDRENAQVCGRIYLRKVFIFAFFLHVDKPNGARGPLTDLQK